MTEASARSIAIHHPAGRWIGGYLATIVVAALALFLFGAAVLMFAQGWTAGGITVALCAAWNAILGRYVWRDARAKRLWRMVIDGDTLALRLPPGRSLAHRVGAFNGSIAVHHVRAVETRLEAYRSIGMANMQRSYALRLDNDELILLGEDRALATALETAFMADAVRRLVETTGLPVRDLGMAEGKGGFLGVLFTAPPPWEAPNLDDDRQATLWRRAAGTGSLMVATVILVVIAASVV